MSKQALLRELKKLAEPAQAKILRRFFKTGPGQYGAGDIFWGIRVPKIRAVVRKHSRLDFASVEQLIRYPAHEVRLCALLILAAKYNGDPARAFRIYLKNTRYINNWDLVDATAGRILGAYLDGKSKSRLWKLARSKLLWERRMSIIATFYYITRGQSAHTFKIARMLLKDRHDLIHKAVGWMLREAGKRCSQPAEEAFLKKYAAVMPRTMLRYAIERFPEPKRRYYLGLSGPKTCHRPAYRAYRQAGRDAERAEKLIRCSASRTRRI
jgi:3-methyladenine DNA glycosylase AlkD